MVVPADFELLSLDCCERVVGQGGQQWVFVGFEPLPPGGAVSPTDGGVDLADALVDCGVQSLDGGPATSDDLGAHFLGSCASAAGFEG